MATRAVSTQWRRSAATLIERAAKLASSSPDLHPDRLYHFTDCAGLIGIFENKSLWASLATSLNDPSEVTYGIELACELFRRRTVTAQNFSLDGMDALVRARAAASRAYIVSFCENLNLAGQWLHYGHSGSGVAVGFYPQHLVQPPYELFRIVYIEEQQIEVIRSIIATIDDSLGELVSTLTDETQRDRLKRIG